MPTNATFPPPLGWPLLPVPDASGQLSFRTLAESVREQIRVILLTRPGEQLMKPNFGAGLEDFLGEPNTVETRRRIRDRIQQSIEAWESRVLLDRVEVFANDSESGRVRVEIFYRIRRTGGAQRIGLTLELKA